MDVEFHNHDGLNTPKVLQTHVRGVYAETDVVTLTGDQTVAGVKTFSSIPVLPASDPTTDNQAVRKAYVDSLIPDFEVIPGDVVRDSAATSRSAEYGEYTKIKEIEFNEADGSIRVAHTASCGTSGSVTVYSRVYVNGVAVGAEHTSSLSGIGDSDSYTDDISVETNDLVQLYAKGGANGYVSGFALRYDKVFIAVPGTVNDD